MISVVDFETDAIEPRPHYPPKPVGVAIRMRGRSRYYAWGHPTGNSCTKADAEKALREAFRHPCVFHNAPFDLEVVQEHLPSLRPPVAIHDTRILAWLDDPNRKTTALKPLADEILNWPPEEQDDLRDWILSHVPGARRKKTQWGRFIALAPGDLVGRYARGDVDRTWGLFKKWKTLTSHPHYEREMRLVQVLIDMGRRGIPIDEQEVERQCRRAEADLEILESWIRRKLKSPHLDLDKAEAVADAFELSDQMIPGEDWVATATDRRSTSIENLHEVCSNSALVGALEVRSLIKTPYKNHLRHWRGSSRAYCSWNPVPFERFGARTGRVQSTPNYQNIAARHKLLSKRKKRGHIHCTVPVELPRPRNAIRGKLIGADYNGQELRILAHYAQGDMMKGYRKDPYYDLHGLVQKASEELKEYKFKFARHEIKNGLVFPRLYGAGGPRIAASLGIQLNEAYVLRSMLNETIPGIQLLDQKLKAQGSCDTWGGRHNKTEEGFEYKLLNTLIQGSAGDQLKDALVRFDEDDDRESQLILTVHDEVVTEYTNKRSVIREQARLRRHMEAPQFRVPMIAEAKSIERWGELK